MNTSAAKIMRKIFYFMDLILKIYYQNLIHCMKATLLVFDGLCNSTRTKVYGQKTDKRVV